MKEKSDFAHNTHSPQLFGHEHKLVIMDPDVIVGPGISSNNPGKFMVHLLINVPVSRIENAARDKIMKEGPDNFIGESIIVFMTTNQTIYPVQPIDRVLYFRLFAKIFFCLSLPRTVFSTKQG